VPAKLITSLETSGHSWLDDLLTGLSGRTDEVVIFHAVRDTIRDLASTGNVILVGHGSVYITRDLPGGTHVRLIAPYELRVTNVAERFGLSNREAARYMHRLDRQRAAFFRRFWPDRPLVAELFTAELNVAELNQEQLIRVIVAMSHTAPHSAV
jgi:cytidylate kinase